MLSARSHQHSFPTCKTTERWYVTDHRFTSMGRSSSFNCVVPWVSKLWCREAKVGGTIVNWSKTPARHGRTHSDPLGMHLRCPSMHDTLAYYTILLCYMQSIVTLGSDLLPFLPFAQHVPHDLQPYVGDRSLQQGV